MSNITNSEEDGKDRVLGYSLLVIDLLIIILNVLAVLVIIRFRTKSAIDIFILALALMDLVKGFIPVPISICIYLTEWYLDLDTFGCNFYGWIAFTVNSGAMLILTLMSLERFWAVVKPFSYRAWVTPRRSIFAAVISIVFSSMHSALPVFGVGQMKPYNNGAYSHFDYSRDSKGTRGYSLFIIIYGYSMIFIVMVAYSFVFYKIRSLITRHRRMSFTKSQPKRKGLNLKQEKMFSYLTVVLMILFWFSWLPFLIVVLVSQLGLEKQYENLNLIAIRVAVINSMMNPLVCAVLCKPYRRGVIYYIKKLFSFVGFNAPESDVFDPWRRSNTCAAKCISSGNKNLGNEGGNQDKPENNWSSYDSGIATAEYSRSRLPSVLHSYDSYRRRAANTTSYNSDDPSPNIGLLDPLNELPSSGLSFEVEEDGQGKDNEAEYDESNVDLQKPQDSSSDDEDDDEENKDKDIKKTLLTTTSTQPRLKHQRKAGIALHRIHKHVSSKRRNIDKNGTKNKLLANSDSNLSEVLRSKTKTRHKKSQGLFFNASAIKMGDSQANLLKENCREIIDRKEPERCDTSSNEKDIRKVKIKITENHQKLKEKGKSVSLTNIVSKYKIDFKEVIKRRPKSYCANANVELTSFHKLEDNINKTF